MCWRPSTVPPLPHDKAMSESSFWRRSASQCLKQSWQGGPGIAQFAFPDNDHMPVGALQCLDRLLVPSNIAIELRLPKLPTCLRKHCVSTSCMSMPETTMYKYTYFQSRQYNIWLSRKVCSMESETVPVGVQEPTYQHFGLRVLSPYGRHHSRPAGGINNVHLELFLYSVVS